MMVRRSQAFIPSYEKGGHELLLKIKSNESRRDTAFDVWPCIEEEGKKPKPDFNGAEKKRAIRHNKILSMHMADLKERMFFVKKYVTLQKNVEVEQAGKIFRYDNAGNYYDICVVPIHYGDTVAYLPSIAFWTLTREQWERARASGMLSIYFSRAITTHKSQGSEYNVVVYQPRKFGDDRERADYTGITRAKSKCIIARRFVL